MNTEKTSSRGTAEHIYKDSKGRPVGLAGKFNKVTNTVDVPQQFPLQTPEDKINMDMLFDRCYKNAAKYLLSSMPGLTADSCHRRTSSSVTDRGCSHAVRGNTQVTYPDEINPTVPAHAQDGYF